MKTVFIFVYSIILSFGAFAKVDSRNLLDAHLHYWPEDDHFLGIEADLCVEDFEIINGVRRQVSSCDKPGDDTWTTNYLDFLTDNKFKIAFLISPSFTMRKLKGINLEGHPLSDTWKYQAKYISVMDKQTSRITQENPGRFIGLCGLNYTWSESDAIKRVSECLNLPGMSGIKMHSYSTTNELPLRLAKVEKVIDKTLEVIKKNKPFVLWHIKPEQENHKEIDILFKMALKYPEIKFVIAHSMYGAKNIEYLLNLENNHGKRLENLFLETSATESDLLSSFWVEFGLDRVLYGSDNYNSNDFSYSQFIKSGLTNEEINIILDIAPKRVLDGLSVNSSDRGIIKEKIINESNNLKSQAVLINP